MRIRFGYREFPVQVKGIHNERKEGRRELQRGVRARLLILGADLAVLILGTTII